MSNKTKAFDGIVNDMAKEDPSLLLRVKNEDEKLAATIALYDELENNRTAK
ncbi:hypothetical protein [Pediococcus argentinicus]|uniref:Uncharacterized protein n=1 Tax=Pediococcus argentinicus TaxID=480391 RepID=A0A0R2NAS3_9LACO|nr:hypothetical protein [Pediococcus argentinicus]KRO22380.1 hypothetical protein IV88_GL001165 [Pediococcus argentinicus]NKZ22876.1 hypothetical protein [Pediococcus argentinicus]GEP20158.1 hypothetical protein LSA03_15420 [Pediococcus argentinicus]